MLVYLRKHDVHDVETSKQTNTAAHKLLY